MEATTDNHTLQLGCRRVWPGSTEWVEENRDLLASMVVAYLNMDYAVARARFYASATPQLEGLLKEVAQQVS